LREAVKALGKVSEHKVEEEEGELAALMRAKNGEGDSELYEYLGFNKGKILQ
jgi:hypothetical protein